MSIEKSIGRPAKAPRVNLKDLKKLIDMMRKAELSEVHIEQEGLKINLKKDEKPRRAGAPVRGGRGGAFAHGGHPVPRLVPGQRPLCQGRVPRRSGPDRLHHR